MTTDKRQFTMRMQPDNFDKMRVIAAINKRSLTMQIEFLMEQCISEYESRHGRIPLNDVRPPKARYGQINTNINNIGDNVLTNVKYGNNV